MAIKSDSLNKGADAVDTERQAERRVEDRAYTPVIVKRNDQATRHPDDVLEIAVHEGKEQLARAAHSLVLSAIAAGAILGFSVMAIGVVAAGFEESSGLVYRLAVAAAYPIGFVLCIMAGTQLFTEHTALAVYPVLDGCSSLSSMLKVWVLVLVGNFIGCALIATLIVNAEEVIGASSGYAAIAHHFVASSQLSTLFAAILAGWLMALGGWLILATPPGLSQMAAIYLVTFTIGLAGLHHAIAGATELMVAWALGSLADPFNASMVLAVVVIGNLIGGAVFVATLNYGHIRHTQGETP